MQLLLGLPRFADRGETAYRPGLDRIRALLQTIGDPQNHYPIIHVAGTNGKGSVASFAASILRSAGLCTGLHTSPHLLDVSERMRVNGESADRAWLADRVFKLQPEIERVTPSFFEVTVALSLLYFAERNVDAAVVEVGLGGRLDATNVVDPAVSVITNIGLDHTGILGETVEEIAVEKAGIIKSGVPIITGAAGRGESTVRKVANDRSAPYENVRDSCEAHVHEESLEHNAVTILLPECTCSAVRLDLPMPHQIDNAVLGARTAQHFLDSIHRAYSESTIIEGLQEVRRQSGLRGRFEVLLRHPLVVADVAHNADGIAALIRHVRRHIGGKRLYVCLALMTDKDINGLPTVFSESRAIVLAVSVESARARSSEELCRLLKHPNLQVDNLRTVGNAIEWFLSHGNTDDVLIVTGSHLAVTDALQTRPRLRNSVKPR